MVLNADNSAVLYTTAIILFSRLFTILTIHSRRTHVGAYRNLILV